MCWIKDTKSVQIGSTVFFKHTYLTMPTITPADKLLTTTCNLREAINGGIPQSHHYKGIVHQFMAIRVCVIGGGVWSFRGLYPPNRPP